MLFAQGFTVSNLSDMQRVSGNWFLSSGFCFFFLVCLSLIYCLSWLCADYLCFQGCLYKVIARVFWAVLLYANIEKRTGCESWDVECCFWDLFACLLRLHDVCLIIYPSAIVHWFALTRVIGLILLETSMQRCSQHLMFRKLPGFGHLKSFSFVIIYLIKFSLCFSLSVFPDERE